MKTLFPGALRASAAAVLTVCLAGHASAAVDRNLTISDSLSTIVMTAENGAFGTDGGPFNDFFAVVPVLWTVTYDNKTFQAYCIDPLVGLSGSVNKYSSSNFAASDAVKRLYEHSYTSSVSGDATSAGAFQLALWELVNDNGAANGNANLLTGQLRFDNTVDDDTVAAANGMLSWAHGNAQITNAYQYTSLTSNQAGYGSQALLSVSAVPEAQTWAMLLAGLGLVGFMRRRKMG